LATSILFVIFENMIVVNYTIELNQFKASYTDSFNHKIIFGPYPSIKAMRISVNEYMSKTNQVCKIKKSFEK